MRTTVFLITAACAGFATAVIAQDGNKAERVVGSGVVKSEMRDVEKFDAVALRCPADVFVTIGEKTEVTVKSDDNLFPYITTEVKDNTLVISEKARVSLQYKELKVFVTTPNLSAVKVEGSGGIAVEGLDGDSFKAAIAGHGYITAKGRVKKLECMIAGSGDLAMDNLEAETVNVKIAGSGDAKINALHSLQAKINGSGDIAYKDHPNLKIVKKILGSGEVHKID